MFNLNFGRKVKEAAKHFVRKITPTKAKQPELRRSTFRGHGYAVGNFPNFRSMNRKQMEAVAQRLLVAGKPGRAKRLRTKWLRFDHMRSVLGHA